MMEEDEYGFPISSEDPPLERLELLLESTLWSSIEARFILAGIHPESSGECSDSKRVSYHYKTLPRVKASLNCKAANSLEFHMSVNRRMEYLEGFVRGNSQSPNFWIKKAFEKDYIIPWLDVAREAGLLKPSKKILQSTSNAFEVDEAAEPVVNPITENARKAGKARQTNSEPHAYKRILVRDWDQKQPCPDDYDSFKQNHQKQYCPKDQSLYRFGSNRNSMSGWFRDLKKVALGENPTGWIVDARAEIEDFEKRSKLLPYEDRIGKKIDKKTDIELAPSMLNGK